MSYSYLAVNAPPFLRMSVFTAQPTTTTLPYSTANSNSRRKKRGTLGLGGRAGSHRHQSATAAQPRYTEGTAYTAAPRIALSLPDVYLPVRRDASGSEQKGKFQTGKNPQYLKQKRSTGQELQDIASPETRKKPWKGRSESEKRLRDRRRNSSCPAR